MIFGHVLPATRAGNDALILDPLSAGIASLFGASCWAAFYVPWGTRTKSRLEHILAHLGVDEARDAANTVRVAYLTALVAGVSTVVGMQVGIAVVTFEVTGTDYVQGWASTIIGSVFGLLRIWNATHQVRLMNLLMDLSPQVELLRARYREGDGEGSETPGREAKPFRQRWGLVGQFLPFVCDVGVRTS